MSHAVTVDKLDPQTSRLDLIGGHALQEEIDADEVQVPYHVAKPTSKPTSETAFPSSSIPSASAARAAYQQGDVALSMQVHNERKNKKAQSSGKAEEKHNSAGGGYVKQAVFGGLDGIMTCFAVIASVAGAGYTAGVVLVLGFANVFGDGASMGIGEYTSARAELGYARAEYQREKWEMDNNPEGEIKEMVEIYKTRGFTEQEAYDILTIMAKYKDFFVDHMMVQELGLEAPDEDASPAKEGFVMFLSFIICGSIPFLPYIILVGKEFTDGEFDPRFLIASLLAALDFFALGAMSSRYSLNSWWSSGLMILVSGVVASAISYGIGHGVELLVANNDDC